MNLHLRAAVARSTRSLAPVWPLSSFIAINPLGAREGEPFEVAATTRPRASFLADHRRGRITDFDLAAAVRERVPELAASAGVRVGEQCWDAAALVARELVDGELDWATAQTEAAGPPAEHRELIDQIVSKWLATYLDPHPLWPMPDREQGLWAAWRAVAVYDTQVPRRARARLRQLPASADAALDQALTAMRIDGERLDAVLRLESEALPGWASHIKWRADHVGDVDLTSFLAIRLTLRAVLEEAAPSPDRRTPGFAPHVAPSVWERAVTLCTRLTDSPPDQETIASVARVLMVHPPQLHAITWQTAYESQYRHELLDSLGGARASRTDPRVQVVFCIDPRSEGMRRHLEDDPTIDTFGFAGFFGVPIRFTEYHARGAIDALPALLSPRHWVTETTDDPGRARRRSNGLRLRDAAEAAWHAADSSPAAPFALAETVGWFLGIGTLLRTLFPAGARVLPRRLARLLTPEITTTITIADAFTLEERAALAETVIRMMGLDCPAPLVVLTGHRSTSTNNLFQSALDCGACGGNPGAANARSAAAIFNDQAVREVLADRGLPLPATTFFVAAEHDTVSDRITVLDPHLVPDTHSDAVRDFLTTQDAAAERLLRERAAHLPGAARRGTRSLRGRADDWAEVYPELGLAGNAALIIGPREMSRGVDLHRRAFLHSYHPHLDPDGTALESIMTAPLVVAQWINHQYYFSTVEPDRWGAGTKTIHNAIGTIGVISGQSGDLRQGLPRQSVMFGSALLHEPMRLSVVIQAPLERIGVIISRNQALRHLFDNGWITLCARNNHDSAWQRYTPYGWSPVIHHSTD